MIPHQYQNNTGMVLVQVCLESLSNRCYAVSGAVASGLEQRAQSTGGADEDCPGRTATGVQGSPDQSHQGESEHVELTRFRGHIQGLRPRFAIRTLGIRPNSSNQRTTGSPLPEAH